MAERINGTTPFVSDEKPDLQFIINGTKSIMQGTGILSMLCPHEEYCPKIDIDTNCFYGKFLCCGEARVLELVHQLSQVNKYYLRYRELLLNGELLRVINGGNYGKVQD